MGITSENVAQRFGVTRLEQDQAAVRFLNSIKMSIALGSRARALIPTVFFYRLFLTSEQLLQLHLESSKMRLYQF